MKFKIKNDLTADIIFEECKSLKNFSGIGKEKKTIIYIINKNIKKIKLFGEVFVNNNKNNCHLLIDNEKKELLSELILNEEQILKKNLEIILIEKKPITNLNCMFYECKSIIDLPGISDWDTKNVTDMSSMFNGCISLTSFPDISKWDITNVTDLSCIFLGCSALEYIQGISKWDTKNVVDMAYLKIVIC